MLDSETTCQEVESIRALGKGSLDLSSYRRRRYDRLVTDGGADWRQCGLMRRAIAGCRDGWSVGKTFST